MARKAETPCAGGCGKLVWRGRGSLPQPTCRECRARRGRPSAYVPVVIDRRDCVACGTSYQPRARTQRYCSERCQNTRQRKRRERSCLWCGKNFRPSAFAPKCCSVSCAGYARVTRLTSPILWRCCRTCGRWYTAKGKRRCGCTRRHHAAHASSYRNRTARYGGAYEEVDRDIVFARDGWRCGLCLKPVDRSASWPDPTAVSLDHIVPLAKGGDHTYANVQCAHLGCNWSKNDRAQGEQLRLVG